MIYLIIIEFNVRKSSSDVFNLPGPVNNTAAAILPAHGDDGMGSLMLKELANELKGVLTIIYNRFVYESKMHMTGR